MNQAAIKNRSRLLGVTEVGIAEPHYAGYEGF